MATTVGTALTLAAARGTGRAHATWTVHPAASTTAWDLGALLLGATTAAMIGLPMAGTGSCHPWTGDMMAPLPTEAVAMLTTGWVVATLVAIPEGTPEVILEASETGQNNALFPYWAPCGRLLSLSVSLCIDECCLDCEYGRVLAGLLWQTMLLIVSILGFPATGRVADVSPHFLDFLFLKPVN